MANYKIYLENGRVVISPTSSGVTATRSSRAVYPQTLQFPADGYLTASVVNTTEVKVVTATGTVIFNGIAPSSLRTAAGGAIGATAATTVNLLNSATYFDFSTDFATSISANTTKLDAIDNALLFNKGSGTGPIGVFYDPNKTADESYFSLTQDVATVQGGKYTRTTYTESSGIGTISLGVATGSTGNEAYVESFRVSGDSGGRVYNVLKAVDTSIEGGMSFKGSDSTSQGAVKFYEASNNGGNYITLRSASSLTATAVYTLPATSPTAGQVLSSTATGTMSWVTKDNYQYFNLKTDGTQRKQIASTNDLDLRGTTGKISLSYSAGGVVTFDTAALFNVVDDTSPQLGGDLDVQANVITTSTTDGNIVLDPNGTGAVVANGHLQLETQSSSPTAVAGGLYADNSDNLYFGVS